MTVAERGPAHLVWVDPGVVWAHGPAGLAVDRREVFLLLFLVGPLNLDNGSVEVPELNFLTPE